MWFLNIKQSVLVIPWTVSQMSRNLQAPFFKSWKYPKKHYYTLREYWVICITFALCSSNICIFWRQGLDKRIKIWCSFHVKNNFILKDNIASVYVPHNYSMLFVKLPMCQDPLLPICQQDILLPMWLDRKFCSCQSDNISSCQNDSSAQFLICCQYASASSFAPLIKYFLENW